MADLQEEPTNSETPNTIESPQAANYGSENNYVRKTMCKLFNTKKGCTRGLSCHFKHETKDKARDDCKFWTRRKCKFSD